LTPGKPDKEGRLLAYQLVRTAGNEESLLAGHGRRDGRELVERAHRPVPVLPGWPWLPGGKAVLLQPGGLPPEAVPAGESAVPPAGCTCTWSGRRRRRDAEVFGAGAGQDHLLRDERQPWTGAGFIILRVGRHRAARGDVLGSPDLTAGDPGGPGGSVPLMVGRDAMGLAPGRAGNGKALRVPPTWTRPRGRILRRRPGGARARGAGRDLVAEDPVGPCCAATRSSTDPKLARPGPWRCRGTPGTPSARSTVHDLAHGGAPACTLELPGDRDRRRDRGAAGGRARGRGFGYNGLHDAPRWCCGTRATTGTLSTWAARGRGGRAVGPWARRRR